MDISIIVVSRNTRSLLLDCLTSIFATVKGVTFEVWLVDNNSTDGTIEAVRKQYPAVNIIANNENLGFAAANNQAFQTMSGSYALLLNSDTVLTKGAVRALYDFMEDYPEAGMG